MAIATKTSGAPEIVLSPLGPRIAASMQAWERLRDPVQQQYPDHFCCTPRLHSRAVEGWTVVETRCVWTDLGRVILPFCDVIELFSPREGRRAYLQLERALPHLPFLDLIHADDGTVAGEFLRISGLPPEELRTLLGLVGTEPPPFRPG